MKKSQLRQLIRESIKELVNEVTEIGKNITVADCGWDLFEDWNCWGQYCLGGVAVQTPQGAVSYSSYGGSSFSNVKINGNTPQVGDLIEFDTSGLGPNGDPLPSGFAGTSKVVIYIHPVAPTGLEKNYNYGHCKTNYDLIGGYDDNTLDPMDKPTEWICKQIGNHPKFGSKCTEVQIVGFNGSYSYSPGAFQTKQDCINSGCEPLHHDKSQLTKTIRESIKELMKK
jgi:hypothetical protein